MHARTLSLHAQEVLAQLGKTTLLSNMYLAGGSALALYIGHRISHDFDFYIRGNVLALNLARDLAQIGKFTVDLLEPPHTLLGEFNGVKISFFRYEYNMLEEYVYYQNVALASIKDIAAMKLSAISGRATKRDYVDLYVLAQQHSFEDMFSWYDRKFGVLGNNTYVMIKSLGYFEDAETDVLPKLFIDVTWEQVKLFLHAQSLRLAKKLL